MKGMTKKMNKTLRKAVIAGNWKMNKTPAETTVLINEIAPLVKDADCDVLVCVPYVDLQNALAATKDTNIKVGAENCHWAKSGAFTAEISAEMLTSSADSTSARPTRPSTPEPEPLLTRA